MGTIARDCPHCGTRSASFNSIAQERQPIPNIVLYTVAFYCGNCFGGYIAEIAQLARNSPHDKKGNLDLGEDFTCVKEYPLPEKNSAPDLLPENLSRFYLQAANSLDLGNLDASAMMSRKVLEVAVKILDPNGNGNLYKRIEKLADEGGITGELKDWAHAIRNDGNEAAHEEDPVTLDFAKELLSFTEMFLLYTFTMPEMIKSRRQEREYGSGEA